MLQTQKAHYKEDPKKNKLSNSKLSFQKFHNPWIKGSTTNSMKLDNPPTSRKYMHFLLVGLIDLLSFLQSSLQFPFENFRSDFLEFFFSLGFFSSQIVL